MEGDGSKSVDSSGFLFVTIDAVGKSVCVGFLLFGVLCVVRLVAFIQRLSIADDTVMTIDDRILRGQIGFVKVVYMVHMRSDQT